MYDCIIVGAGPAGGTAAYHLAKRGRSVLILEKDPLLRYKPCGGGVSPVIAQWFDFDFSPAISVKADSLRFTWKLGDAVEAKIDTKEPFWMVQRDIFDHFLVQQAQSQGALLKDNTEVKGIEFKTDHWQVNTANGVFTGRYLIAADGATGPMSHWLGFKVRKQRSAVTLEANFPEDPDHNQRLPHFEFGLVKNGYIWNFPKADGYSISVSTFIGGDSQDFTKVLDEYSKFFHLDKSTIKQHNHALCLWNGEQKLHTQNAILAGEAACLVDPLTAEGIRPSIFSGVLASQTIDRALDGDIQALEKYTNTINEEWGTEMNWAQKLSSTFYRFPGIGYKLGVKRPSGTQIMSRILCGELRYGDIAGRALKRLMAVPGFRG